MTEPVRRPGFRKVLDLPAGYDERTTLVTAGGVLFVAHPDFKPCRVEGDQLVPLSLPPHVVMRPRHAVH